MLDVQRGAVAPQVQLSGEAVAVSPRAPPRRRSCGCVSVTVVVVIVVAVVVIWLWSWWLFWLLWL